MAGLALLAAEDEPSDEELRAEGEAAGIDFDAWAAEIEATVAAYSAGIAVEAIHFQGTVLNDNAVPVVPR